MRVSPLSPNIERDLKILAEIDSGESFASVARKFGISRSRVAQIKGKSDRLEAAGRSYDISIRLINAMKNEGFLVQYGHRDLPRDDDVRAEMQSFYDHIMEILPASEVLTPWGRVREFSSGYRWVRMPNFGPKTLEELKNHLGISKDNE